MTLEMSSIARALDVLCPMHLHLDHEGRVLHAGPTLKKCLRQTGVEDPSGASVLTLFHIERPRAIRTVDQMMQASSRKLHLRLRQPPQTAMKAVLTPHPIGAGALMDVSFGISILDAVRDFRLTGGDFAPTDLTVEMLYLVEAKSAAMEATRSLNARLRDAMTRAEEQALTDTLTGLKNRRAFDQILASTLEARQDFTLMHLDLDFFKQVNDTLGHAAGDHVLQVVARIMREETRGDDIVARVGGDEFILIFPGLVNRARLAEVAQRLISRIKVPIAFQDQTARISASGGLVRSVDYANPDADTLIGDADEALYASKKDGRGRFTFFQDMQVARAS